MLGDTVRETVPWECRRKLGKLQYRLMDHIPRIRLLLIRVRSIRRWWSAGKLLGVQLDNELKKKLLDFNLTKVRSTLIEYIRQISSTHPLGDHHHFVTIVKDLEPVMSRPTNDPFADLFNEIDATDRKRKRETSLFLDDPLAAEGWRSRRSAKYEPGFVSGKKVPAAPTNISKLRRRPVNPPANIPGHLPQSGPQKFQVPPYSKKGVSGTDEPMDLVKFVLDDPYRIENRFRRGRFVLRRGPRGGVYCYDEYTGRKCRIPWLHQWKGGGGGKGKIRNWYTYRHRPRGSSYERRPTTDEAIHNARANPRIFPYRSYNESLKITRDVLEQLFTVQPGDTELVSEQLVGDSGGSGKRVKRERDREWEQTQDDIDVLFSF